MKNRASKNDILFRIGLFLMLLVTLGYLYLGEFFLPVENQVGDYSVNDYSQDWSIQVGEQLEQITTLPIRLADYSSGATVLKKELPKQGVGGKYLCFWNRGNVLKVYVDDELRQEYDTEKSRAFGFVSPYLYIFVPLQEADAGKTIRIEMNLRNNKLEEVLLGERLDLIVELIQPCILEMIFAFLLFVFSILCLIIAFMLYMWKYRIRFLEYFSLGTAMASIWIMTNSGIRQFFFPNVSTVRDVAFLAFAIFPMFFIMSIDEMQERRYHKTFRICNIAIYVSFWVMVLPYFFGVLDFDYTKYLVLISEIVTIIYVVYTILNDVRTGAIKKYRIMATGIVALAVAGMVQAVSFWLDDSFYTAVPLAVGLAFALLCAASSAVMDMVHLNVEKDNAITANKAKGDFLANMSHEIRTPINAVLGMDEMILRESTEPEIRGYAQNIKSAGTSLLSLINDILDFSKIENGKMDIIPAKYEMNRVLNDIAVMLQMRAEAKGLKMVWDIDSHIVNHLYGDDVRIRQVLVNLLTNAIKYTEKGEVTLYMKGTRMGGNQLQLEVEVRDTGIGIKPEDIEKLLSAFQRVDEGRNRNIEGTGLGLSITGQLLQLMGSELKIESTYGVGSTFSFVLMQEIMDFQEIGKFDPHSMHQAKEDNRYKESFVAPQLRILLVDDTDMNLKIIKALLKKTQVQIDAVLSGREALGMVTEKKYDLILLDHMMPEMDGLETLAAMKKIKNSLNKDTKVIALTANAISGASEMYREHGFDDVLFKPVDGKKLEDMIREKCEIE